jgi:hypothetical protein
VNILGHYALPDQKRLSGDIKCEYAPFQDRSFWSCAHPPHDPHFIRHLHFARDQPHLLSFYSYLSFKKSDEQQHQHQHQSAPVPHWTQVDCSHIAHLIATQRSCMHTSPMSSPCLHVSRDHVHIFRRSKAIPCLRTRTNTPARHNLCAAPASRAPAQLRRRCFTRGEPEMGQIAQEWLLARDQGFWARLL